MLVARLKNPKGSSGILDATETNILFEALRLTPSGYAKQDLAGLKQLAFAILKNG